jgi:hypothetical protein
MIGNIKCVSSIERFANFNGPYYCNYMIMMAKNIRSLWSTWVGFRPTALSRFMGGLQLYYLYEVFASNDTGGLSFTWTSLALVVWSIFTVSTVFKIVGTVFNQRWVSVSTSLLLVLVYATTAAYHFGANDLLAWGLIIENLSIAFSPESADVIANALDTRALVYGIIICIVFLGLEWRYQTLSKSGQAHGRWTQKVGGLIVIGLLIVWPINSLDPLLNFSKSVYFYYRNAHQLTVHLPPNTYPFRRELPTHHNTAKRPLIFLIVVESLNASALNKVSPNGIPYTPFLNALQTNSVFIDPFYGNSIQTAKGHFGLFFSFMPALRGKIFVKHPDLRIDSLGTELQRLGYRTHAFAGHKNRQFDNTARFLTDRGIGHYVVADDYLHPKDRDGALRWGVKDAIFFKRFFDYFDANHTKNTPEFYTLLTIANHFPFNSMPPRDRQVYPEPTSIHDHYANSVRLVDDGLRVFFDELKRRGLYDNSLVIITSDHAFPMGEHGNFHLEAGYHEESFRIPFFLTWPNQMNPTIIREAHSQLDIAPTILDLLSVPLSNTHFMGQSVFSPQKNHLIPLIQPYAKQFSLVSYPYKYRFSAKNEHVYYYNLATDPMETTPINDTLNDTDRELFEAALRRLYMAQHAIENNQVQPPAPIK